MLILTEQRELFCQHFFANRDGPEAYRHAYNVEPETKDTSVASKASQLLATADISDRLAEMQRHADMENPTVFTASTALHRWLEIANADPDELTPLRVGSCRYCWGEGGGYQWKEREYFRALEDAERRIKRDKAYPLPDIAGGFGYRAARAPNPDCDECEGDGIQRVVPRDTSKLSPAAKALFGGVKMTKDGPQIIIADRMKALENASRIIGAFNDRVHVDGSIAAMLTLVREKPATPEEASREYQRLIARYADGS